MATKTFFSAMSRRLEGKVALITGGASGIGECTAKVFTKHGAKVVIADVQDQLGQTVREAIGSSDCTHIHCDVTNEDNIKNAVDKTVETYGKLDIMLNNAGTADDSQKVQVFDIQKSDFERVMSVNVTGVFLGMKHAARVMVPAKSGCIISTASAASVVSGATPHAYTCSKHAVVGLTRNMAVELGQFGIRVNCMSPYYLATRMTRDYLGIEDSEELEARMSLLGSLKGAILRAEDAANAALYLASDEAKYVSGHNLVVDGGFSIHNSAIQLFKHPPPEEL